MNEYFKFTLGGILLLLVAVSCYFWYKWETQPYREEYLKTQQFLREWTSPQDIVFPIQQATDVEIQSVSSVERQSVSTQHGVVFPSPADIPSHIKVVNFEDGAIDLYKFLNLPNYNNYSSGLFSFRYFSRFLSQALIFLVMQI